MGNLHFLKFKNQALLPKPFTFSEWLLFLRIPTRKGMVLRTRDGRCPSRALPARICQSLTRRLGAWPRFMGNYVYFYFGFEQRQNIIEPIISTIRINKVFRSAIM